MGMCGLLNAKGQSSRLVAGSVDLSELVHWQGALVTTKWSGLLILGCSLVGLPCFLLLLVAMQERASLRLTEQLGGCWARGAPAHHEHYQVDPVVAVRELHLGLACRELSCGNPGFRSSSCTAGRDAGSCGSAEEPAALGATIFIVPGGIVCGDKVGDIRTDGHTVVALRAI